jgi:hypothetical protein
MCSAFGDSKGESPEADLEGKNSSGAVKAVAPTLSNALTVVRAANFR